MYGGVRDQQDYCFTLLQISVRGSEVKLYKNQNPTVEGRTWCLQGVTTSTMVLVLNRI